VGSYWPTWEVPGTEYKLGAAEKLRLKGEPRMIWKGF